MDIEINFNLDSRSFVILQINLIFEENEELLNLKRRNFASNNWDNREITDIQNHEIKKIQANLKVPNESIGMKWSGL